MLRAFRDHEGVQLAQNNHYVKERALPDDPQLGSQWQHVNINSAAAWDVTTGGVAATSDTIVVCIIERSDLFIRILLPTRGSIRAKCRTMASTTMAMAMWMIWLRMEHPQRE